MPHDVGELVELLDLEPIEDNLFRGRQPDTMMQRVFGGQVAAHALVAGARTVGQGFTAHSLHAYFLHPGDTSVPIVYDVDDVRDGRSFATRLVRARQHGRPIFGLTASFQKHEGGFDHQDAMPDVPPPDQCRSLVDATPESGRDHEEWEREWAALEVRFAGDSRPGGGLEDLERPARQRLWIRVNGRLADEPLLHQAAFTYASDMTLLGASLVPHGVFISSPLVQAASLDHSIWFHRPFRADEWWLYDQVSPSASGARGLSMARVFTEDGRLVASVAQEGLIRQVDPTRTR
ncbi:acyl-CoA thioesterase [Nocardioides terrisoli]|uniref:acyl-CoA thioesterase n=1 Tax=Nocardioides terrisoli TaxID=3388267 RepID=UPI00287B76FF|nr:acyl-CoA thioesterase II [Nocardioides marmorisolisilvae]